MRAAPLLLLLALLATTFAADDSCVGRCEAGFNSLKKCQCDSMCKYYQSCCFDFEVTCGVTTRGDTFAEDDDDDEVYEGTAPPPRPTPQPDFRPRRPQPAPEMTKPPRRIETTWKNPVTQETPVAQTAAPPAETVPVATQPNAAAETTAVPMTTAAAVTTGAPKDPDAEVCSGRPFHSFMQQKDGSMFAFRGDYFFQLDQRSVVPGYPKLIKDVWGIDGPIDAAFTRVNCQGKTYIFKGDKYWRFENGVVDEDYPRDISVGFDKIPDHVDAAFALPAPGHDGREKVYFFKGGQYHTYEFLHQPSHAECVGMTENSPSALFRRYTELYYNNYERGVLELFSGPPQHHDKHHFIDRDWKGLRAPLDAAMAGRMYVPPARPARRHHDTWPDQQGGQQRGQQWNQQWNQQGNQQGNPQYQQYGQQWDQQWGRRRQRRSPAGGGWGSAAEWGMGVGQEYAERGMEMGLRLAERRMEMQERLGRDWDRRWNQDWDQQRRQDGHRQNHRGHYDSRGDRGSVRGVLPIQSVYFFKGATYYRVDLKTKKVDLATPPYPRSIAKYWFGCSDATGAEK